MASRRRLDISSLLCDNEQASTNVSDSHASRSPVHSPTGTQRRQDTQPAAAHAPARLHLAIEYSAAVPTNSTHSGPHYEYPYRLQQQVSPTFHGSPTSRPSSTVLTPLALQPSPPRRRTPSPPFTLSSASSVDPSNSLPPRRRSEDLQGSDFPRRGSYTTQDRTHPHPYTHYPPLPSSTSPVNVHEASTSRRASLQLRPHRYSPVSQTRPSPSPTSSLPSKFPSSAHRLSISPTELPRSAFPSASGTNEPFIQRSPVLPRSSEANMFGSRRTSASMSPTVPTTGLSGLDVLVQAATEERERIDVHRRQSGGEERQPSSDPNTIRPTSLSPVEVRSPVNLQALPPPAPPYTASSQMSHYMAADKANLNYKEQAFTEDDQPGKHRRPSSVPSRSPHMGVFETSHHRSYVGLPSTSSTFERRSHSPETKHEKYDSQFIFDESSHRLSSHAKRPSTKPGSMYIQPSSARSTTHQVPFSETQAMPHFQQPLSPVEPTAVRHVRRSPPRSRPRPKKPGSAALALMEKEFREVALADRVKHEPDERQTGGLTDAFSPPRQTQTRPSYMSSKSLQSNERGAVDDEDVDDFFNSTFDSPKNSERTINPRISHADISHSRQTMEEGEFASARWGDSFTGQSVPIQTGTSAIKSRSSSPEGLNEFADRYSPVQHVPEVSDEAVMSEVEADILDELADAAGAATSEDERTEFDDQATDNMEVDVENELLSLVDGPLDVPSKPHHHPGQTSLHVGKTSEPMLHTEFNQTYMPPSEAPEATSAQVKDSKKVSSKSKAKAKVDDASTHDKLSLVKVEESVAKPMKSKSGSKARPTKSAPVDKSKAGKIAKEASAPASPSLPTPATALPSAGTPTDEMFPMVTSSGRMVTKSKKSAAAATPTVAANHPSSSHNRKKPALAASTGDGNPSRSRSHSVMPRASADPEVHREKTAKDDDEKQKDPAAEEVDDADKDKLYCICRTQYDEDRVMIACDRCDEWYHTQCVGMPDLLVDLVDQFICENCIAQNPNLNLRTTYKQRCYTGLNHPDPDSPDACHKPSRGAYSKYCSDECGVRHMHRKIQLWAGKGGDVRSLWESVKDAKRREGFVVPEPGRTLPKVVLAEIQNGDVPQTQANVPDPGQVVVDEEGRNSIVIRLEDQLQTVVQEREELKKELEVTSWRERLLQLASDRAENVGDCGWDQRLVYGDEEWLEFGAGVLESYEDNAPNGHSEENQDMEVDGQGQEGEWWCHGKKKCERHMGWQRVRAADIEKERFTKERALADLTTREREIRSRIEDILHPQSRPTAGSFPESTFKFRLPNANSEGGPKRTKKKVATAA